MSYINEGVNVLIVIQRLLNVLETLNMNNMS